MQVIDDVETWKVIKRDGEEVQYPICEKWDSDTSSLSFVSGIASATSFLIVFFGFFLRNVFIRLVGCTGESSQST